MSDITMRKEKRVYELYSSKIADEQWDIIVIGSGMGGMSCSAAASKYGNKVLRPLRNSRQNEPNFPRNTSRKARSIIPVIPLHDLLTPQNTFSPYP